MSALIIVMLVVQAGIFLVTALTVLPRARPPTAAADLVEPRHLVDHRRRRRRGRSPTSMTAAPARTSSLIARPLLLGMGLMAALLAIRQRRGLDGGS